jgi:hypothetical protein
MQSLEFGDSKLVLEMKRTLKLLSSRQETQFTTYRTQRLECQDL